MNERLKNMGWGIGGALVAILIWVAASTVYNDHLLLQQVVQALNQAAQARQQQASPAAPQAPVEAPKK